MLSYDKAPPSHYGSARSTSLSSPSYPSQKPSRASSMPHRRHLFIVTGPAGCGKTTIAKHLAQQYDFPYIEGDDFHPAQNVAKMSANIPLNDGDRWDWLCVLRDEAVKVLETGASGAVLTCSALKKKYRDVIRLAAYNDHDVLIHFIYLRASEELLLQRVLARQNHFMGVKMVRSQFVDLEEPKEIEHDVLQVDVSGTEEEVQKLALDAVRGAIAQDAMEQRR